MHASAVAFGNAGLLITGASGSGKSTLALQLISIGARLVADDRVLVAPLAEGGLHLKAPDALFGLIEARGLAVLKAEPVTAIARAVVDLDSVEKDRIPNLKEIVIAGETLRLFSKVESPAFPAMLRLSLAGH
ncbi:MAG: serine kinase [Silicimonas sp.]|nr:serine kinase [Silicimonas sp.]